MGFTPGGGPDITARFVAQKLTESWKQQVIVDNRPGAGGTLAAGQVARANPDGYTLLSVSSAHAVAAAIYPKLPYDTFKDLAGITETASSCYVLVVPPSPGIGSLKELVAAAQRDPGKLNYASTGVGATPHLAGEMLRVLANAQLVHVPYKGNGPAMTDLLAGRVDSMFPTLPSGLPYIKAGRLRALAVTGDRRSNLLPDVPTVAEQGWPGYRVVNWFGILGPAKMPPAILEKLHRTLVEGLEKPQISERLGSQGVTPESSTPHELAGFMKEEIARWAKLVKSAKITAE